MAMPELPEGWAWHVEKLWDRESMVVAIVDSASHAEYGTYLASKVIHTERNGTKYGLHWIEEEVEKTAAWIWKSVEREFDIRKLIEEKWPQPQS